MAFARERARLLSALPSFLLGLFPPSSFSRGPPREGELEALKEHARLSAGDAASDSLSQEALLHRHGTGSLPEEVVGCCLVSSPCGDVVEEDLESVAELTELTKDQRLDAADLLEPPLERPRCGPLDMENFFVQALDFFLQLQLPSYRALLNAGDCGPAVVAAASVPPDALELVVARVEEQPGPG